MARRGCWVRDDGLEIIHYSWPQALWESFLDRASRVFAGTFVAYSHRGSILNPFDAGLMSVYMQGVVDGMAAAKHAKEKAV